jgi:P27 family predicted phage terminase small subunit
MQGRKPTPTALKLIQGNPGRRPLNLDEFRPDVAIPRCPGHLQGEGRKEWKRISAELAKYGLMSEVDRAALTFYCINWARHVEAEEMIKKAAKAAGGSGLFVKTPNGYPVQSPWLAVSNKAMGLCKAFLAEFGMSPAARTRVTSSTPQLGLPSLENAQDGVGLKLARLRAADQ